VILGFFAIKLIYFFFTIDVLAEITAVFNPNTNTIETHETVVMNQHDMGDPKKSDEIPEIKIRPQVFNIPSNTYDYPNAKAVCKAYGARLASYEEVEKAYNKGAEWCNYGWSQNQQALFPTQKATYDKLQSIKGHENDCGRQGVNGGFISNPNVKFGVNCYGYKPEITTIEQEMMEHVSAPHPLNKEDADLERQVEFYKKHIDHILISPFNAKYWSKVF
jgi:hypothetical protein